MNARGNIMASILPIVHDGKHGTVESNGRKAMVLVHVKASMKNQKEFWYICKKKGFGVHVLPSWYGTPSIEEVTFRPDGKPGMLIPPGRDKPTDQQFSLVCQVWGQPDSIAEIVDFTSEGSTTIKPIVNCLLSAEWILDSRTPGYQKPSPFGKQLPAVYKSHEDYLRNDISSSEMTHEESEYRRLLKEWTLSV